ncbi:tail assembly chaperone [Nocardia phage NC1]|jgi:hypothetical protein|nr:tail assembly chaperone [Nocardia phage NC1]QSL67736.1 tail assembly chaperone [Nocardia phage P69]
MDDEFAAGVAEARKKAKEAREAAEEEEGEGWNRPSGRSTEGFTPELAALYNLDERMQQVARVLMAANSKSKPPDIQKNPRPFTALDLMELEEERDEMHDLARTFGLRKDPS